MEIDHPSGRDQQFSLPLRKYPAKLLLMGEYSVLLGGPAVAVPLHLYSASWEKSDQLRPGLAKILIPFMAHLRNIPVLETLIDINAMHKAFEAGYYLKSTVPSGAGLGSSGVFCAAVFDAFGKNKELELLQIRECFQLMESFFHGKSSGLDPMVSYFNCPLLSQQNKLTFCKPEKKDKSTEPGVWLLNSQMDRNTSALVPVFDNLLKKRQFRKKIENEYLPLVESAIARFLSGDRNQWFETLKNISKWQLEFFTPMIPDSIGKLWESGIKDQSYYMKLCGAGGGGFFFLFSDRSVLPELGLPIINLQKSLSGLGTHQ